MPVTPYHFGFNGTIAFILRRYLDFPLMILANIAVDIEVAILYFMKMSGPSHRYTHTLLLGGILGVILGCAAFFLWPKLGRFWNFLRIPFQLNLWKLIISGVLGCWLHVIFDSVYHWEIRLFWPLKLKSRFLYGVVSHAQLQKICILFWMILIVIYLVSFKKREVKNEQAA